MKTGNLHMVECLSCAACLLPHVPGFHSLSELQVLTTNLGIGLLIDLISCKYNVIFYDELMMSWFRFVQEERMSATLWNIYRYTFFRCYMIFSMSENNIASDIPCFQDWVHKYLTILRIWADPCFQYKTSSSRFLTSGYFYLFDGNQALWRITGIQIIIKKDYMLSTYTCINRRCQNLFFLFFNQK